MAVLVVCSQRLLPALGFEWRLTGSRERASPSAAVPAAAEAVPSPGCAADPLPPTGSGLPKETWPTGEPGLRYRRAGPRIRAGRAELCSRGEGRWDAGVCCSALREGGGAAWAAGGGGRVRNDLSLQLPSSSQSPLRRATRKARPVPRLPGARFLLRSFPLCMCLCCRAPRPRRRSLARASPPYPHPLFSSSLWGAGLLCKYLNSASAVS